MWTSVRTEPTGRSVTTIADNDQVTWSIVGDTTVDEGGRASFTVDLSGTLQAGETAQIQLAITDVDTSAGDYTAFATALEAALDGRTELSYDAPSGVLTYRGDGTPMTSFQIDLVATDDVLVEGPELYDLILANSGSSSGAAVTVSATSGVVSTTINDTVGEGGADGNSDLVAAGCCVGG